MKCLRGPPGKPGEGGAVKRAICGTRVLSLLAIARLSACLLLLSLGAPLRAQDAPKDLTPAKALPEPPRLGALTRDTPAVKIIPGKIIRTDVDLALVNVTVTDPYNRLVTGLETDNFRVFEDNMEQEIVSFSSEDVPISIGVIFDFSGSMRQDRQHGRQDRESSRGGGGVLQDGQSAG